MKIIKNKYKLHQEGLTQKSILFVPTMGGLHKGHCSLIKKAKKFRGKVLVSIFVNPKQFNNKNDFNKYPRNLNKDLQILKRLKVNYVYIPNKKEIFSLKIRNKIFLDNFSKKLCGRYRKGHFKGVLNVVNRFLELIKPKLIFLGKKDYQQLYLIKKHILKRKIPTKVIACNTIREKNGIACSTRNKNLNNNQIKIASNTYKYLLKIKNNLFKKTRIKNDLIKLGVNKIEYIEFYNIKTLKKFKILKKNHKIFIAYYLNKTRLIDNI